MRKAYGISDYVIACVLAVLTNAISPNSQALNGSGRHQLICAQFETFILDATLPAFNFPS